MLLDTSKASRQVIKKIVDFQKKTLRKEETTLFVSANFAPNRHIVIGDASCKNPVCTASRIARKPLGKLYSQISQFQTLNDQESSI